MKRYRMMIDNGWLLTEKLQIYVDLSLRNSFSCLVHSSDIYLTALQMMIINKHDVM